MKCVSLFSGCGGLDLGLKQAGFSVVMASDIWPLAKETHQINFPETKFFEGSITDLSNETLARAIGQDNLNDIDLLAGGPPCPPFSKSRFYRKEKPRALDDPSGKATLEGYLRVLEFLRPKVFLFENVHGFAYKVHSDAFDHLKNTAESLGYSCSYRVINTADYGVPQIRQRFFMVGTLDGEFEFPEITHSAPDKITSASANIAPWITAGDAISDIDTEENASDEGHFAGGKYHDLLKEVPPGDNYLFFTEKRGHPNPVFKWRSRYWSFLLKLSPDLPSWTIQARRSNNMGPLHWRNRILRIGELKRLQTFPDDFYLAGTVENQWRQIGNAVPPLMAKVLGDAIRCHLEKGESVDVQANNKVAIG